MQKWIIKICCIAFLFISFSMDRGYAQNQQEELYSTALRAFDDGFYDVAIRYLEQFLQDFPDHAKIVKAKLIWPKPG